jgi:hypothetical protein
MATSSSSRAAGVTAVARRSLSPAGPIANTRQVLSDIDEPDGEKMQVQQCIDCARAQSLPDRRDVNPLVAGRSLQAGRR